MPRKEKASPGLLRKKDGSYSIKSKSGVREALAQRAYLYEEEKRRRMEVGLDVIEEELSALTEAINTYVLTHYEASDGYEDDEVKITKVVSHRRTWNVDKLEKLLPRAVFRRVIEIKAVPAKIDQEVRAGNIKHSKIEAAFEETPNQPYPKWSAKKDDSASREEEAESLAVKLND